ncbi:ABC transporter permease [Bifidobacterium simiarum]|uniref:ABC transporter permease n=1 Tax=Bifidobacterium simiarum TaxID=2045441 RepID=UPI001BDC9E24|nr:ABC transporter permease [Bifidobacterium simiarum]MBT1165805.1 hypothetical protein [Bifidobacterium simiarum]
MSTQHVWNDQAPEDRPSADRSGGSTGNRSRGTETPSGRQQPEYGQYLEPEYGEMANRYPNWNPYVYGEPDPEPAKQDGPAPQTPTTNPSGQYGQAGRYGQTGGNDPYGRSPYGQSPYGRSPYGTPGYGYGPQTPPPGDPNDRSRYRGGIDLEDPNQNPLYGRWDPTAIIAFIMALMGVPIIPMLLGGLSVYRTGLFRMKGRGLAIAAVIISLITMALAVYLTATGMDPYQFIAQLYGFDSSGGTGGSGGAGGSGDGATSV